MIFETFLVDEGFLTFLASVLFLLGMGTQMGFQVILEQETPSTLLTLEATVSPFF